MLEGTHVRIGFMSSVAPHWNVDELITAAREYGFQAIELRVEWGHKFGLERDSPKTKRQEARQKFADAGIAVSCLALGTRLAKPTAEERQTSVEEVARYAELAADLGAPVMRVFGGPVPEGYTVADLREATTEALGQAAARAADHGATPCLETHDHFNNPADVAFVVGQAGHPNVGVVWHAGHHLRLGISVADAYQTLRPWIRHCHISEQPKPGEQRPAIGPIPLGSGDGNVVEMMRALHADSYQGVLSWEWINGTQVNYGVPDTKSYIDPRPHLEQYATKLREYLAQIG